MKVFNSVIFGESEIQQKNVLLSVKITFQDTYSEGLIIFLSLTSYMNQ